MRGWQFPQDDSGDSNFQGGWNFKDDDVLTSQAHVSPAVPQPEPEVSTDGLLAVTTRVEYTTLPKAGSHDVFGLVTLQAGAHPAKSEASARQPVDVVCVLDVSGSMYGGKLALVQDAVRFVIGQMQADDRLSLVAFNHAASRPLRLRRMDGAGKDDATRETLKLASSGGTSIARGLDAGLAVMEQRQHRNRVSAVLLLTDGQDGTSQAQLAALVNRARVAGCALYAFGFGADHDAALLSSLAEQAQTPFSFVEEAASIRAAFAGTMGGLVSVAMQNIELQLKCQCALKAIHTPFSVQHSGSYTTVQIPDLLAGERRDVLVELTAPEASREEDIDLLTVSARYWDLHAGRLAQTPSAVMLTHRLEVTQPELEPDVEVAAQRCRVEVTQVLGEARAHGDAGRFDEAQAVLAAGKARLCASPKTETGDALELELDDAAGRLRDHASWEDGGRAELADMWQMHSCQRSTNMIQNMSKSKVTRCSKAMYTNSVQKSWLRNSGA